MSVPTIEIVHDSEVFRGAVRRIYGARGRSVDVTSAAVELAVGT